MPPGQPDTVARNVGGACLLGAVALFVIGLPVEAVLVLAIAIYNLYRWDRSTTAIEAAEAERIQREQQASRTDEPGE